MDGDGLLVTGEDLIYGLFIRLLREEADDRHDDESDSHGKHAGVDRRGEGSVDERHAGEGADEVCRHQPYAADKACPHRGFRDFLAVETVEERRKESSGKRAPGYAHELRDEGDGGGVLYNGDHGGDGNEEHDEHADDRHLALFRVS